MIPPALERLLVLLVPLDDALLDPLHERVDHGGLQLGAELLSRLDHGLELLPVDGRLRHGSILPGGNLTWTTARVFCSYGWPAATASLHAASWSPIRHAGSCTGIAAVCTTRRDGSAG